MEDVKKTIATEDVEKRIGKIKKAHKRYGLLRCSGWISAIIAFAMAIILVIFNVFNIYYFMDFVCYLVLGLCVVGLALTIVQETLMKHASKEVEELKHNYVRLKLVSQGYYDFCSFFISPDKTTFLQGPKTNDEKILIIFVWEAGTIDSSKMTEEEFKAMFEPMFK